MSLQTASATVPLLVSLASYPAVRRRVYKLLIERIDAGTRSLPLLFPEERGEPDHHACALLSDKKQLTSLIRMAARQLGVAVPKIEARHHEVLDWLAAPNRHAIIYGSKHYPYLLSTIADPPLCLLAQGTLASLALPALAIVGSRRAQETSLALGRSYAKTFAAQGWVVASGLAKGVDGAAHRGALESGSTIGVLGAGIDRIYPSVHRRLASAIEQQGLLLSEYTPTAAPMPQHFPYRNRIIAGLSMATIVIEAGEGSGSLITAKLACSYNREVFVVPGSSHDSRFSGSHALCNHPMARLLTKTEDLYHDMYIPQHISQDTPLDTDAVTPAETLLQLSTLAQTVYHSLGNKTVRLDQLELINQAPAEDLIGALAELECAQVIARNISGSYYAILSPNSPHR